MIFTKQVLQETNIKGAIIKKIGKLAAAYFQKVVDSDKSEVWLSNIKKNYLNHGTRAKYFSLLSFFFLAKN